jgi:hypothetical protein
VERATEDDRLRQRLLMKASRKAPKGLDLATYRAAIDSAVDAGEFVDYRSAYDYAQGIDDVVDSIEALLKVGYALEVIDLTEHALAAVEEAMVLMWAEFTGSPSLKRLQNLKRHADRVAQWPAWRNKALAYMREEIVKTKRASSSP